MSSDFIHIPETISTNTYIKELADKLSLAEGTTIYTDFQLAGRGQRGNYWESEKEKNLLFSIIIHPYHIPPSSHFVISQVIAISIIRTLDEYIDNSTIKWPNDIYYEDKKICGILIENELQGKEITNSIIGVGLNINQLTFESGAPNPTSIKLITEQTYNTFTILQKIQKNFMQLYKSTFDENNTIASLYFERLYRKEGYHKYKDSDGYTFDARIINIEKDGYLELELKNSERRKFAFKEIKYIS